MTIDEQVSNTIPGHFGHRVMSIMGFKAKVGSLASVLASVRLKIAKQWCLTLHVKGVILGDTTIDISYFLP